MKAPIPANTALSDTTTVFGDSVHCAVTTHTALVFGDTYGFQIAVPTNTETVLDIYLSTDGTENTFSIREDSSTGTTVESGTVSTYVDDDYTASEHFTFKLKNDTASNKSFYLRTESGTLRLMYLSTAEYEILGENSSYTSTAGTVDEKTIISTSQTLPVGCTLTFDAPAYADIVLKGTFSGSGDTFIVQDKTHHYTESQASTIISEQVSAGDYTWTFKNDTPEEVSFGFGSVNGNISIDSLTASITPRQIQITTRYYIDEGTVLTTSVTTFGTMYRANSDHSAITFSETSGFTLSVPASTVAQISLWLSTNGEGESGNVIITENDSTGTVLDSATVDVYVNDDYTGSKNVIFEVTNDTSASKDYFIRAESGLLRLMYLADVTFIALGDDQRYTSTEIGTNIMPIIETQETLPVGCESTFSIPAFSDVELKGRFSGTATFLLQDKTHHFTEPFASLIISEEITDVDEHTWTFTNDTAEAVTYGYGTDGELACDELTATVTSRTPQVATLEFIPAGTALDDFIVYGDRVHRSNTDHSAITINANSGLQLTIPAYTVARIGAVISTETQGETQTLVITHNGETFASFAVTQYVDATTTPAQKEFLEIANTTNTDAIYYLHTESGELRLAHAHIEYYEAPEEGEQWYRLTYKDTTETMAIQDTTDISTTYNEFEVDAFTYVTITAKFASEGTFIVQDRTHNFYEPDCDYVVQENVTAGEQTFTFANETLEPVLYGFKALSGTISCDWLNITAVSYNVEIRTQLYVDSNETLTTNIKTYGDGVHRNEDADHPALVITEDSGLQITVPKDKLTRLNMYLSEDTDGVPVDYVIRKDTPTGATVATGTVSTYVDASDKVTELHQETITNTTTTEYYTTTVYNLQQLDFPGQNTSATLTMENAGTLYVPNSGTITFDFTEGSQSATQTAQITVAVNGTTVGTYDISASPSEGTIQTKELEFSCVANAVSVNAGDVVTITLKSSSYSGATWYINIGVRVDYLDVGEAQNFYLFARNGKLRINTLTTETYTKDLPYSVTSSSTESRTRIVDTTILPTDDSNTLEIPAFGSIKIRAKFEPGGTFFIRDLLHRYTEFEASCYFLQEITTNDYYECTIENARCYAQPISYGGYGGEITCYNLVTEITTNVVQAVTSTDATLLGEGYYVVTGDIDSENITSNGKEIWSRLL